MREASVGFQCPECVSEGRRQTRSGRAAYGGTISARPQLTSIILIAINVAVWLAITATGGATSKLVHLLSLRARGLCIDGDSYWRGVPTDQVCQAASGGSATWFPGVDSGAYWQLITSGFTHVEVIHLAMNCFFIYMIGPQLEAVFGRVRFLIVYFMAMLSGSVMAYWLAGEYTYTLGASGAAWGLMGGLLVVMLKRKLDPRQLLMLIGINLVFTFAISNISWQGHIGGLIGGALAAAALVYAPAGPHRSRVQWLAVVGLVVVFAALTFARSAALT